MTVSDLRIYRSTFLAGLPWLAHGFSTRAGGCSTGSYATLNLGANTGDEPGKIRVNRERFFTAFNFAPEMVHSVRQVHGDRVVTVQRPPGGELPEADGLVTALPGTAVATTHADCVPVLIVDPVNRVTAAVHAGWKGTLAGIVRRAVDKMQQEFQTKPGDCLAAIGPAIGGCCYRVSPEREAAFHRLWPDLTGSALEKETLDLAEINRRLLCRAGLAPDRIDLAGICTACHREDFFSYRRDQGCTGRMLALVILKEL